MRLRWKRPGAVTGGVLTGAVEPSGGGVWPGVVLQSGPVLKGVQVVQRLKPAGEEEQVVGWGAEKLEKKKEVHKNNTAISPFQGDINGLLVNAAAPLTDPAVVSQQLGSFLHLLQNLLPFLLNFRQGRPPAFPLLTWIDHSGGDWTGDNRRLVWDWFGGLGRSPRACLLAPANVGVDKDFSLMETEWSWIRARSNLQRVPITGRGSSPSVLKTLKLVFLLTCETETA